MIADIDGDFQDFFNVKMPESVPILPVRNLVLFPGVVSPILIGRESSKKLIRKAEKKGQIIGVLSQRDPDVETPLQDDLHEYGVYGRVVKQLTLPNGNITAIVQAMGRMRLNTLVKSLPYLEGEVEAVPDIEPEKNDREFKTAMDNLRELVGEYINVTEEIPDEASFAIKNISNDFMALNFVCCNMPFSMKEKMNLLTAETVKTRLFETMKIINREIIYTVFEYEGHESVKKSRDN